MKTALRAGAMAMLIATTGCVNKTTVFHTADGRQTGVCSASGFGLIRSTMARSQYNHCRDAYLKAGFVEGPTN